MLEEATLWRLIEARANATPEAAMAREIAESALGLETLAIDRGLPGLPDLGPSPGSISGSIPADLAAALPPPPRELPPADLPVRWLFYSSGTTADPKGALHTDASLWTARACPDPPLFPRMRAFPGGGAPKPPQLHYDLVAEIGGAGICSGWGLTEAPNLTMASLHDPSAKQAESDGRPSLPEVDLRAVKSDGSLAGPGESGELRVRAPQVCRGYLDASLDAAAFDEHGYFRTGDLGCIDAEGYVVITGRLKDVIIRKGENIPAKEVEDLLYTHPKVAEVAVIGLPDAKTGERCCARFAQSR